MEPEPLDVSDLLEQRERLISALHKLCIAVLDETQNGALMIEAIDEARSCMESYQRTPPPIRIVP